jgi:hypothetical protein
VSSLEKLAEFIKGQILSKGESKGKVIKSNSPFYNRLYHFAGREYKEHVEYLGDDFFPTGVRNIRICLPDYAVETVSQTKSCTELKITRAPKNQSSSNS